MDYRKACFIFGNGDFMRGQRAIFKLAQRIQHARNKHPVFADGAAQGSLVIRREHDELVYAVHHESLERQQDEALDVACTAMRFVNGEHIRRQPVSKPMPWDKWGDE